MPQALIDMEHVVLMPHIASASVHTRTAMGKLVLDNLASWFAGKGPLTPVPETPWKGNRVPETRLASPRLRGEGFDREIETSVASVG